MVNNSTVFGTIILGMSTQTVSKEQVEKIAKLCKLEVTEAERVVFAELFSETLTHIENLQEIDTSGVQETYQVTGLKNVYQQGKEAKTLTSEEALKNAPNSEKSLFVTKAVFDR